MLSTVIRPPMLGAQNQSLPPLPLIFCPCVAGKVLSAGANAPLGSSIAATSASHGLIRWV